MKDYFLLAIRNLKRRGLRSWLTLLGIVIGITTVVSLITLGSGLQAAVNSQFGVSSTQVITVQAGGITGYGPPGTGVSNPLERDDADAIEKISGVEAAIPRNIEPLSKISYRGIDAPGFSMSLPDKQQELDLGYELLDLKAEKGRLMRETDNKKILLGYNFLEETKNPFERQLNTGEIITIKNQKFQIIGFLQSQGSFIFDNIIAIKDSELKDIAGYGDEVDVIAVKVRDKDEMEKVKEEIEELMRDRRNVKEGQEDFSVETPEAMLEQVNEILGAVQAFIIIIASISIFVGAVGIVNTMTTSVLERVKEIGIMKAVGARNSQIFVQFFIESGMLGLIGGIIGTSIGIGIGFIGVWGINNFLGATTKPQLDFMLIGAALAGSFLIGAISGISPALNAARKDPVESLRS